MAIEHGDEGWQLGKSRNKPSGLRPATFRLRPRHEPADGKPVGKQGEDAGVVGSQLDYKPRVSSHRRTEVSLGRRKPGEKSRQVARPYVNSCEVGAKTGAAVGVEGRREVLHALPPQRSQVGVVPDCDRSLPDCELTGLLGEQVQAS
jgi:hypothetical protein